MMRLSALGDRFVQPPVSTWVTSTKSILALDAPTAAATVSRPSVTVTVTVPSAQRVVLVVLEVDRQHALDVHALHVRRNRAGPR